MARGGSRGFRRGGFTHRAGGGGQNRYDARAYALAHRNLSEARRDNRFAGFNSAQHLNATITPQAELDRLSMGALVAYHHHPGFGRGGIA